MNVYTLDTGRFKLDGGAMFGVVPKSMWSRQYPADDNNMCTWALRCLLVQDGNRLLLVDNGIGDKQDEKFRGHFYLHGDATLEASLRQLGFTASDVTDVLLTHLHFDHCGGSVVRTADDKLKLAFPNATYWSNEAHWQWAVQPNAREKASFLKENILPIQESGHLRFINPAVGVPTELPMLRDILFVDGHTEKMMLPVLDYKGRKLAFVSDLLPSSAHVPLPWIMGYDMRPLQTLAEKEAVLQRAADEQWVLVLEHDAHTEACTVQMTDRGPRLADKLNVADL